MWGSTVAAPSEDGRLGGRPIHRVVYDERTVQERVRALGAEITRDMAGREDLLVLGLLKGSFVFVADLVRHVELPLQVDFLVAASYGPSTESGGEVRVLYDPSVNLRDRAVIVVEDVVDSGTTLRRLLPELRGRGPASLDVCALLHKRLVPIDPEPRWVGFDAPNEFLVGYGLDYAEDFRHLPYIASL